MAIRIVIAGLGPRGCDWVREVRACHTYELVACVDIDPEVLQQSARELLLPPEQCFEDLKTALDHVACEAVIIATSADQHTDVCCLSLSRGLAVLVEKPFTLHVEEAVRLVRLAQQNHVPLVVAQNYRYMRAYRATRNLIREGALGRIAMVAFQYYRIPHAMVASLARLTHSVLWGMSIHHLDGLRYVLGQKFTGVIAQSFTQPDSNLPVGASLQALFTLEGGTRGLYGASYESSGHEFFERGQEFYARYTGDLATLHVCQRWLVLCPKGGLPRLIRRGPRKITEEQILLRQLERALLHGEEPESSGCDNLQTVATAEACVISATKNAWINPQELLP